MPKSLAAPSLKSWPSCSVKLTVPRRLRRPRPGVGCTLNPGNPMPDFGNARRRFLATAAGFSVLAVSGLAKAQFVPPASSAGGDDTSNDAPTPIQVEAHPIASFDRHDHGRVRFGALEFRSGLVLASSYPNFGGLSGLRLDAKGERFISFSDKGRWFTGRIVYDRRAMTGL